MSLNRNEFGEIVLSVGVNDKSGGAKTRNVTVQPLDLEIHRKFVREGKLSLSFKSTGCKLLLSNAPPHDLVIFVKTLAAKLAGTKVIIRTQTVLRIQNFLAGSDQIVLIRMQQKPLKTENNSQQRREI